MELMQKIEPGIEPSWKAQLNAEFESSYFRSLRSFLKGEKRAGKVIYPPGRKIFSAFNSTPFDAVKIVIIGQDPYHGEGQANGMSFSVAKGIAKPPSLLNIFKELKQDLGYEIPNHGDLSSWAKQGVLLLNATLTVEAGKPASHHGQGWETFTDAVIKSLSDKKQGLIFFLWGRFAGDKAVLIDPNKHHILKSAHPSPFSAYKGFVGCKHFSKANRLLNEMGKQEIDWTIV